MHADQSSFTMRGVHLCESVSRHTPAQIERLLQRLSEWKMNTLILSPQYGGRLHGPLIRRLCREQDLHLIEYTYVNLAFVRDAPRKFFAVDDQGNPHGTEMACETRLCANNAGARKHFREGARRYLEESVEPNARILLAPPDGMFLCACKKCQPLNATAQWMPFLEIALEEIARSKKGITTHYIAYVGRFRPPQDMAVFDEIDAVMFDTHLRHRWLPLGARHALGPVEHHESRNDPEAATMPINQYLLERLREWRAAYSKTLYVFENLMMQSCFSLPQPNTPALLEDLETYRRLGVDGVIYEAFEPGISAFAEQLGTLASAMRGQRFRHPTTAIETVCQRISGATPVRTRTLAYLFEPECADPQFLAGFLSDAALRELARDLREYLPSPSFPLWRKIAKRAMEGADTLDWIYITHRLATYLPDSERPASLTPTQRKLFSTPKVWDFLEESEDPRSTMRDLLSPLIA